MEIWISGIGFTRTRSDTRRILETQYPILWDWVLKFKINRILDKPEWVSDITQISTLLFKSILKLGLGIWQ